MDAVAWSHNTPTHYHTHSSQVYLGMSKGPLCKIGNLWLLIVNDKMVHTDSHTAQ